MAADNTLSPEVGKPLQQAQALMKSQKFGDALKAINQASALPNKTPYEVETIARMRGAAALGAGEPDVAEQAFSPLLKSMPAADRLQIDQGIAVGYYRTQKYPQAVDWAGRYFADGGNGAEIKTLNAQALYLSGKYAEAAKALEAAGTLDKAQLELLSSAYVQAKDNAGAVKTLKRLVAAYPSKPYWAELIARVQHTPNFPDSLGLDVYRLQRATGTLTEPSEYMEMAQLSVLAGFPIEAKQVVDQAYTTGAFGTGADADRQNRLRKMVTQKAADDQKSQVGDAAAAASAKNGDVAVNIGYNFALAGQADKGANIILSGLQKGNLKDPNEAKLQLGIAYMDAGQKAKAVDTFKSIQGTDGAAQLAQLWVIFASQG
jgi:tetratricopeptide (TPR) repeat protein